MHILTFTSKKGMENDLYTLNNVNKRCLEQGHILCITSFVFINEQSLL